MEYSKETRRKWIKNNYIKIIKFGLQKENKPKLEHEEQRGKRRRNCSLDFGPKNVHQMNYKILKIKWYTWENPKPPKDA
jgi:hypothetical protein